MLPVKKNTGQVARIEGFIDGARQWQQRFQYDSLGRLDVAKEQRGDNLQGVWSADYDYDRFGNRRQSGGGNQNLSYFQVTSAEIDKTTNRLTGSSISYDDAGNVAVDNRFRNQQYSYDGNGRQVKVSQTNITRETTAVYDGLGQRVQSVENGSVKNLVYDQFGQLVAEYGGQAVGTGGTHYMMADHQGSARVVMNASAGVEARHDYLPFGEEIQANTGQRTAGQGYSADTLRHRYAGMERDGEGVDHTLWRKYESRSGRWTSPDPYSGSMSVGDPQSFNRYAYVGNDPVNRVDPTGLIPSVTFTSGWANTEGGDGDRPVNRLSPLDWANLTSGGRGGGIQHPLRWVTISPTETLRRVIGRVENRIKNNKKCRDLFTNLDPNSVLKDSTFISNRYLNLDDPNQPVNAPFAGQVAITTSVDVGGQRQAAGVIVFNPRSFFFTGNTSHPKL